jgi:hypothetical protein
MPHGNTETPANSLASLFQTRGMQPMANNRMHLDSKKRRSFVAQLFAALGDIGSSLHPERSQPGLDH